MKYTPRKVFIKENGEYTEISYEELCRLTENNPVMYSQRRFIPLHGMLMEVTEDVYRDFYRDKRRQKYLSELSEKNGDISYDMLTTDEFNGEDILIDNSVDVAAQVENKIMTDKLHAVIKNLTVEEQKLLYQHFYQEISQTQLSRIYGVNQSNISRRICRILQKLKKLMES